MSDRKRHPVRTEFGRAALETAHVRGFDVYRDLVGDDFWSLFSVAIGSRRLTPDECAACDALSSMAIGDPRIWPMKVARLISAYGHAFSGVATAFAILDRAPMGAWPVRGATRFFQEITSAGPPDSDAERMRSAMDARLGGGGRIEGFGVPARDQDERNSVLETAIAQIWTPPRRHWALYLEARAHARKRWGLEANLASCVAAIASDLGYDPPQASMFTTAFVYWGIAGNALAGTIESPERVREIPVEFVEWVGSPPRKSPRALADE